MNNLEIYVNHAQPVVKTIKKHHNQFYTLWYYNLSPEDLFAEDGLIEYQTQDKNHPEHFSGTMPMVYAQWGEETGAAMVLEISPENRKLLSPEVIEVLSGGHPIHTDWDNSADEPVYVLMDHKYYQTCAGFEPADDYEYVGLNTIGTALDFLSHRLGLSYLFIENAHTDIEWKLNQ